MEFYIIFKLIYYFFIVILFYNGFHIRCTIKNPKVFLFRKRISRGSVYVITNYFSIDQNNIKFKSTRHEYRVYFRKDTILHSVKDSSIPINSFCFEPYEEIFQKKERRLALDR
ncbi:hypothetical protein AHAS_Ahas12G0165400 [Arachis hypogaea]